MQVESFLIALQDLIRKALAIGQPFRTREIDIRIRAEIDPARVAASRSDETQFDRHVGTSRSRIALLDHFAAVGVDLEALDLVDAGFVVTLVSDGRIVGRPPVAGEALEFFLGDEFRFAVVDRAAAVPGQLHRLAGAGEIDDPQILLAHVRDVAAFRRDLRVDHRTAGRQFAQRIGSSGGQIVKV